ncbi:discoidin domain-containing protein [Methylomonas sp. MgM2]
MRKRVLNNDTAETLRPSGEWLDLEAIADVEVTSENPDYPIESALLSDRVKGWRAAGPGKQTIRLLFTQPQQIHCISLEFRETECQRTQEYVLRVSQDNGHIFQEMVRQQWNFSPEGSTSESESHRVDKDNVTQVELIITPDIQHRQAIASLERLRVA